MHQHPLISVLGQSLRALFLEMVVLASSARFAGLLVGFDQTLFLQAVQDGVEHAVGPLHLASG